MRHVKRGGRRMWECVGELFRQGWSETAGVELNLESKVGFRQTKRI